jgi:type IV pilus assembly protein PilP
MKQQRFCLWLTVVLLSACKAEDGDDLTRFMHETDQLPSAKIEPLPQVHPFVHKQYNADGGLRDPFFVHQSSNPHRSTPDLQRPREPLEAYPLESLRFVGVISRKQVIFALIQTSDNMVYQVKPGNHLGDKLGLITALRENPVTLKYALTVRETIQDADSGEWTTQTRTIELQGDPS